MYQSKGRKMKQQFSNVKLIYTIIIGLTLLVFAPLALAQNEARVHLQSVNTENGVVTVDVIAENVTEMYGAEFRLKYDPAIIAIQDLNIDQDGVQIEPGTLLPTNQGFVVANQVNETEGVITFAMTLLNPAPAANGSGPLARVRFNMSQNAPSKIDIEHVKLVSRDLQTIPSSTESFAIAGEGSEVVITEVSTANNALSTEVSSFPWWIVAAAIMILGTLALGGLIIMGNNKPALDRANAGTKSQPSQQPQPRSTTRPSAFKQQSFPPEVSKK